MFDSNCLDGSLRLVYSRSYLGLVSDNVVNSMDVQGRGMGLNDEVIGSGMYYELPMYLQHNQ